jgi:integrase/recombinase XerC
MNPGSGAGLVSTQAHIPVSGNVPILAAIEAFLGSLESQNTRRGYRADLRGAFGTMGIEELGQLNSAHLNTFREHILADGRSPNSQKRTLAALRSFLGWVADMGGVSLPERMLKRTLKAPRAHVVTPFQVLSPAETFRLLATAAGKPRPAAMVLLLLGSGIRAAELVRLDASDLITDPDGGMVLNVLGKGRKSRLVPVQDEVAEALQVYLAATGRRVGDVGPLFLATDRGAGKRSSLRMDERRPGKIIKDLCAASAIAKRISPHSFRHTFAVNYIRNGGNVVGLSELLGHSDLSTTQVYPKHLELAELRRAIPRYTNSARP